MSGASVETGATGSRVHLRATVAGESYALSVEHVTEVAEYADVTPVPGAPAHILGVINLRGNVTPVASLAQLLGLPAAAGLGSDPTRMVVAESGGVRLALAVDDVSDVTDLDAATEPTDLPLLRGAVLVDGTLVGIVDLPAVLRAVGES